MGKDRVSLGSVFPHEVGRVPQGNIRVRLTVMPLDESGISFTSMAIVEDEKSVIGMYQLGDTVIPNQLSDKSVSVDSGDLGKFLDDSGYEIDLVSGIFYQKAIQE